MLFRRSAITIFLLSVIVFSLLPNIFFLTSHSEQVSTTKISSHVLPKIVMFDLPSLEELDDDDNHMLLATVKELIDQADFFLTKEPSSVMEKEKNPPSGNKHDFFSLALFWWPDNTKNDSMPYVYRDGMFNPEVYSIPDRKNIHDMIYRVKILSVAYYLTNNTLYASKATELLRVWSLNNDTQMNPNLQFAEFIYGKNNGSASGIITTSYFSEVLDSIKLLQSSSSWTTEDQRGIETWFNKYLVWLLESDFGKREQKRLNNHGTWYDFQTSSIALFLNKTEIVRDIIRSNIEQKIDTKIDSNGSQPY